MLTKCGVQGVTRLLNHSHFPDGRAHGFAALANIGVLRVDRAQPLYLLTPTGRFGPLPNSPQADAFLRPCRGLGQRPKPLMPRHFSRALRASEGRKKRGFLQKPRGVTV